MSHTSLELTSISSSLKPTDAFLAEWRDKPEYLLLTSKEASSSNYMVLKEGLLIAWARTVDPSKNHVFVHSRKALVTQMGEDQIALLEASLIPTKH